MHPFSTVTLGIFVAGYITARWDLVTRLYELAIFAAEYGVVLRAARGIVVLSAFFLAIFVPVALVARRETRLLGSRLMQSNYSTHEIKELEYLRESSLGDEAPSECCASSFGWRNSTLDVFVVTILEDVDAHNVEFHLRSGTFFRSGPHSPSRIYDLCGHSSMHVLGISNAASQSAVDPSWVCAKTSTNSRYPRISCAKASSIQLILYDRPHPKGMQYISLNPIALALGDKGSLPEDVASSEDDSEETKQEKAIKENRRKLAEKLKQHSIVRRVASARDKALPKIVNQVNWSWELEQAMQQNVGRLGPRPKRGLSVSERVVESATTMRNYVLVQLWTLFSVYLFPIVQKAFILVLLFHRMVAEILLIVLEFRAKPGYAALKDISATAQQIEIRLQQFCYWPMQYVTLRQRKANWASVTTSHPDYIRFYNSLWLVANDVIIGMAVGSYIIEHKDWVADQIRDLLRTYTVEALQRGISWLMGWPAGLKLNGELAAFLGDLFLWVIDYWSSGIHFELRDTHESKIPDTNDKLFNEPPTSIIYLKNIPLPFHDMFNQYFQMAHRIRKHYLSPRVLLCLVTGQFVPPINRKNLYSLQYSMLPARRATVWEMWRAVNMEIDIPQKKPFHLPNIPALQNGGKRPTGLGRTRSRD
ncbi:hypothetical protein THAR02_06598 [Trichoderma harzianum]|uniref:Uncharacterized protein n=1 Tax=Trichoderma harzianum TaxID=5544 RepID=A0A0F9X7V6_TRIHA|nr:hypothetical protein THAR02_06598 [Trichoderma harzianum]